MRDGGEVKAHPVVRLGDVADVLAGDPAPQNPEAFAPDGPLFVRMQDVGRDHLNPALCHSADRLDVAWLGKNRLRLFPKDSVLIPKSGVSVNLNHRAKLATDAYVVSHLAVVISDRTKLDPDYLFWWSVRYDPRAQVQVTSLPSLKLATLKDAGIRLPPLDEQRRIAGILNRAARIERLRARADVCLDGFAPALFARMFGDPAENPMGWLEHSITELLQDGTRYVRKIQRRDYKETGKVPIIDQGISYISGYSNEVDGQFDGAFPAIIFGDHTRRFKLIHSRFFLGADGTKLLIPKRSGIDPVFLFAHLKCLSIDDAGYSRHFKFLKKKRLMVPPLRNQMKFRAIFDIAERLGTPTAAASRTASALTASLMDRLLDGNPTR